MRNFGIVLVLGLAACGGKGNQGTLGQKGGTAGSLAAVLARDIGAGGPVAIVPTTHGLVATSADGARAQTLVDGPIRWALVDNRAGVVWFGKPDGTTIEVLDLEGAAAPVAVSTVVTGLPTETDAGVPLVSIAYPEPSEDIPMADELSVGHPITPHVVLQVEATSSLHGAGGILDMWDQTADFEAKIAQAKVPGQALLAQLAARGKGKSTSPARVSTEHQVDGIDASACDEADYCGKAEEVTAGLWRVVTSFSCGDGCYTGWQLYDPGKKVLFEQPWARELSDVWLSPDGAALVSNGVVIRLDSGPLPGSPALDGEERAMGGGWLGGGTHLP